MEVLVLLALCALPFFLAWIVVSSRGKKKKKVESFGYEVLSYGDGGTVMANYFTLCLKDDIVYIFHGHSVKRAVPIEVISISEITKNSRLVQLEMRYRENGVVRSTRFKGTESQLLTIEDKLGYGG